MPSYIIISTIFIAYIASNVITICLFTVQAYLAWWQTFPKKDLNQSRDLKHINESLYIICYFPLSGSLSEYLVKHLPLDQMIQFRLKIFQNGSFSNGWEYFHYQNSGKTLMFAILWLGTKFSVCILCVYSTYVCVNI